MSENDAEITDPWFDKVEELKYGIKTALNLVNPLFDSNKNIIAGLQIQYKSKRGFSEKEIRTSNIDHIIFGIFSSMIQLKMDTLLAEREVKVKKNHLFDTLWLASRITTQRSYKNLIREIKCLLPLYFDFQAAGVLLLDTKTKNLFTISEISRDKEDSDCDEYAESGDIITFPWNIGITGHVFQKEEVYISNDAQKDKKYTADIDNLTDITEIDNFMIGPVYISQKERPVGVVQLINKNEKKVINNDDLVKFRIIQELLGRSISNTAEIHELINVTIGYKTKLANLKQLASSNAFEPVKDLKAKRTKFFD